MTPRPTTQQWCLNSNSGCLKSKDIINKLPKPTMTVTLRIIIEAPTRISSKTLLLTNPKTCPPSLQSFQGALEDGSS